jgi:hypothetical protein
MRKRALKLKKITNNIILVLQLILINSTYFQYSLAKWSKQQLVQQPLPKQMPKQQTALFLK